MPRIEAENSLSIKNRKPHPSRRPYGLAGKELADWMISQCRVEADSGCWIWMRSKHRYGYGKIRYDGELHCCHRLIFALLHPEECVLGNSSLCVLHRCDNPSCINPEHLFLGTQVENIRDMVAKSRHYKGEQHWSSRLKQEQVLEICHLYEDRGFTQKEIGLKFGVSHQSVSDIIRRKIWAHIHNQEERK